MTDKMLSRKEGGVGYVIFNNPERHNAVSLEMWAATRAILDDFRADNSIRVVVLTGAGGKAFVSGADISKFGIPAAKLGLGYDAKGIRRLIGVVGPSFAKEIFFTARQFDAEEARMMGFVNRVVPDGELETYVKNYAETIAGNAPLTIGAAKFAIQELLKDETERDMQGAADRAMHCFESKDYIEGRTAFMEKRKPAFTGQ